MPSPPAPLRILLLGCHGQVGTALSSRLPALGEVIALGRAQADFAQPATLRNIVLAQRPDIIVNAAAYTAVDRAETEPALARAVNTDSPGVLARAARELDALVVHYSTDYVFDGRKPTPYVEDDATAPQSVYGRTKRDGEDAVRAAGGRHLILRTSWVYAAHGHNFVQTMLRLAREREVLRVVADQFGAPTSADTIADVTTTCLTELIGNPERSPAATGTYHLTALGWTSWHGLATAAIEQVRRSAGVDNLKVRTIDAITTADYPLPAPRPANSRLCCDKLRDRFGVTLPDWRDELARVVQASMRTHGRRWTATPRRAPTIS